MRALRTLPVAARLYVLAVSSAAVMCAVPAITGHVVIEWPKLVVLAVLFALCECVGRGPNAGRNGPSGLGARYPVLLGAVIMLSPPSAALVAMPSVLVPGEPGAARPLEGSKAHKSKIRRVWYTAQLAVSAAIASQAYRWAGGPRSLHAADLPLALFPALFAALVFCLVSAILMAGVLIAAERSGARAALSRVLLSSLVPYLAYGVVGLTMAVLWRPPYGPWAAVLVLLPMYVSCWVFAQYHREQAAHHATVRALVQAVDLKDEYTRGHSERVGRASVMIGREIGMSEDRLGALRFAGVLHDVGKLGVPTRLLRKSGPLTPEERRAIQLHPEYGQEMVRGIAFLSEARAAILHHHERVDGRGYPHGLTGGQIPEFARVVAVADAFDAMTSSRSYRSARPVAAAVEELERCAGSQFDPRMVRALARAVHRHGWVTSPGGEAMAGTVPPGPGPAVRRPGSGTGETPVPAIHLGGS